jgi:hypothetical protein
VRATPPKHREVHCDERDKHIEREMIERKGGWESAREREKREREKLDNLHMPGHASAFSDLRAI